MKVSQEKLMERTKNRLSQVEHCRARIAKKVEQSPEDPRAEAWKARIAEYDKSLECINFTLKTGKYVRVS